MQPFCSDPNPEPGNRRNRLFEMLRHQNVARQAETRRIKGPDIAYYKGVAVMRALADRSWRAPPTVDPCAEQAPVQVVVSAPKPRRHDKFFRAVRA